MPLSVEVVCYSAISIKCLIISVVDLQLDVKGCKDVYASFDKYVEVERLEADNKYHAEQYGLQVSGLVITTLMANVKDIPIFEKSLK